MSASKSAEEDLQKPVYSTSIVNPAEFEKEFSSFKSNVTVMHKSAVALYIKVKKWSYIPEES